MSDLTVPTIDLGIIAPEMILLGGAIVLLFLSVFPSRQHRGLMAGIAVVTLLVAGYALVSQWGFAQEGFGGMVMADKYAVAFNSIFLLSALLAILLSINQVESRYLVYGEYFALLLTATVGMMLMAAGHNLLIIFLGLETLSISLYILAGLRRRDGRSVEAAFKYFLLGAFSTGFLLYGIALLYGITGTMDLRAIMQFLSKGSMTAGPLLVVISIILLLVGFGFKIALVPFHMWTPDVYQGAPTPVAAFMSAGSKGAAFAALMRTLTYALGSELEVWRGLLWVLAVLTMTVGNVIALSQTNVKRLLAYSSIAHAGYILIGVVAANDLGNSGVLYYLLAYSLMNIGAFGIVASLGTAEHEYTDLASYRGLGYRRPMTALAMAIFMFSLAGLPPTAGFFAKFYVFSAAVKERFIGLVIIGVINAMVSLYYYLKVVVYMYMQEPEEVPSPAKPLPTLSLALMVSAIGALALGLWPGTALDFFQSSVEPLMAGFF